MIKFFNAFLVFIVATVLNWFSVEVFASLDISLGVMLLFTLITAGFLSEFGGYLFAFMSGLFLDFFSDVLFGGHALVFTLLMVVFYHIDDKIDFNDVGPQIVITTGLNLLCVFLYGFLGFIFTGDFLWTGLRSFVAGSLLTGLLMPLIYPLVTKYLIFNVFKKNNEDKKFL